jgi:hypothetical protein
MTSPRSMEACVHLGALELFSLDVQQCVFWCRSRRNLMSQPTTGSLWCSTFAILFLFSAGCDSQAERLTSHTLSASREGSVSVIQYGHYPSGQLAYVAFASNSSPADRVRGLVSQEGSGYWLTKPDGTKIRLPAENLLFESIDGRYRESKDPVTKEQLEAFIESAPEEYSIDALSMYIRNHPKITS